MKILIIILLSVLAVLAILITLFWDVVKGIVEIIEGLLGHQGKRKK